MPLHRHAKLDDSKERKRTIKRVLLTLLGLVVVIGLFSAVGYAGYRLGLAQGVERAAAGDMPRLRPFADLGPRMSRLPDFELRGGIRRGFIEVPVLGFGFFILFRLIVWIAVPALVIWLIWWLFARSGWRLVRETGSSPAQTEPAPPRPENE